MNSKSVYLVLCVCGLLLPMSQFIPWMLDYGLDIPLFLAELFSTRIGAFFGMDVVVSAIVLFVFMFSEQSQVAVPWLWVPVIATFCVGVSLGFPLYLYMRQIQIDQTDKPGLR